MPFLVSSEVCLYSTFVDKVRGARRKRKKSHLLCASLFFKGARYKLNFVLVIIRQRSDNDAILLDFSVQNSMYEFAP